MFEQFPPPSQLKFTAKISLVFAAPSPVASTYPSVDPSENRIFKSKYLSSGCEPKALVNMVLVMVYVNVLSSNVFVKERPSSSSEFAIVILVLLAKPTCTAIFR